MNDTSWILELRRRLESPPPRQAAGQVQAGHALLVPLFVEAGELWLLLRESLDSSLPDWERISFHGAALESGEDPWKVLERGLGTEPSFRDSKFLRLGTLDNLETLDDYSIVPCVAAIPRPERPFSSPSPEVETFAVPFSALSDPRMVEERRVDVAGREAWIRVYHMGSRRIAGVAAQIVETLIARVSGETPNETTEGD